MRTIGEKNKKLIREITKKVVKEKASITSWGFLENEKEIKDEVWLLLPDELCGIWEGAYDEIMDVIDKEIARIIAK